jgi:alkanesulfonate monooxygenase SsuD/methylene tetrahydromethanopterin reductase-like flavin-dependent oxidoreductase (luciferase family)
VEVQMQVGIGLPSTIPWAQGRQVIDWARAADASGFSSLGTIDRLVYGNDESLATLAAAAAVTERARLVTSVLIAPLRANTALLAKQAATVDHLSGGRLVLGLAVGNREDDFQAAGVPFAGRGRRFEAMLDELRAIWAGEPRGFAGAVGPTPAPGRPTLLIGGQADAAFERAARYGDGWIAGGGDPDMFGQAARKARAAWTAQGRDGAPRLMALAYFSLGPEARQHADRYLHDYYGFLGPWADRIAAGALTGEQAVRDALGRFEQAGCDELLLFPCDPDPAQVDALAAAIG